MNKTNFDSFPISMQKSLKQLKSIHTEEESRKQLLKMKSQALKFVEEIDKELNNQKKKTSSKRDIFAPINLSVPDDEVEVGDTSIHSFSTQNTESSFCWSNLKGLERKAKPHKKSTSTDYDLSGSKILCHCPYCEGITVDGRSSCFSKRSYSNEDDDDEALYELLAQRYE